MKAWAFLNNREERARVALHKVYAYVCYAITLVHNTRRHSLPISTHLSLPISTHLSLTCCSITTNPSPDNHCIQDVLSPEC